MATRVDHGLEVSLGVALKTWGREALLLLYRDRFSKAHPNKSPYEILMQKSAGKFFLNKNKAQAQAIEKNEVHKFDISALHLLLRYACNLSNAPRRWKDLKTLEGNIEKLKELRNMEAHWTEEVYSKANLEEKWVELVKAITVILKEGGFGVWLPIFKENLQSIKQGEIYDDEKVVLQKTLQSELRELYRSGRKTTLMPLVWAGRSYHFKHDALQVYITTKFSINQNGLVTFIETNDLLEMRETCRVMVLQGESGTGKTSLLRYLASVWKRDQPCPVPTLSKIDYLIFLDCNAVSVGTFTYGDIIREVFSLSSSSTNIGSIVDILKRATDSVMFLIDCFDERLKAFEQAFKDLQRKFPKATFLVTTRPHSTPAICNLCEDLPLIFTAHGFNWSSAKSCVSKLLAVENRPENPDELLKILSPHQELVKIPQLLCWSTWLWLEQGNAAFSTRGQIFYNLTDFLLRKLCHINGIRIFSGGLPEQGQKWLSIVAQCAYDQGKIGLGSLSKTSEVISLMEAKAMSLELMPLEALSSLMQCDSFMSARGEHLSFQFIHNSHANFLIAYHVCERLRNDKIKITNLLRDLKMDQRTILTFVVSILFRNKEESVGYHRLQEIAYLSRQHVKFYDINFFLDLIEESQYDKGLAQELARYLPLADTEPSPQIGLGRAGDLNSYYLWIRKKEIERSEALEMLLSVSTPSRLWLRLSDGIPADDDTCASKMAQYDAEAALNLIRNSYKNKPLCELKLSDFTVSRPLAWPQNLWWLDIYRCKIETDLGLQEGLLKLSMCKCTNLGHVSIPSTVKSLKLQEMDVDDPALPPGLETLVVRSCQVIRHPALSPRLKKHSFINCIFEDDIILHYALMNSLNFSDDVASGDSSD